MEPPTPKRNRWPVLALLGLAAAVFVGVYAGFDPAQSRYFPPCLFHQWTGLDCPGCGSQRAVHQLLHGNLGAALRYNALLVLLLPLLAWWGLRAVVRVATGREWPDPCSRAAWAWTLAAVVVLFFIARNLSVVVSSCQ